MPTSGQAWRIDCAATFDPLSKKTATTISLDLTSLTREGIATCMVS